MLWRAGILSALIYCLLLAAPAAAAGIERATDSQGVIRISNCAPGKPGLSRQAPPAAAPGQKEPAHLPKAAPPAAAQAKTADLIRTAAAAAQEISRASVAAAKEPVRENPITAVSPETGPGLGSLPIKKVAYEAPGEGAAPGPKAAAPLKKPEYTVSGGIYRFRDSQGVLHITSAPPGGENPGAGVLHAKNSHQQEQALPEEQPAPLAARETAPALQKVAWNPDNSGMSPLLSPVGTARIAASGPSTSIRRYRDSKGIIHIDNVGSGGQETIPPPGQQARAQTREETGNPENSRPPPPLEVAPSLPLKVAIAPALALKVEIAPQLAFKPAVWSGEEGLSPRPPLEVAASRETEITTAGGIRRSRDSQGSWRIESVDAPSLRAAPPPPPQPPGQCQALLLAGLNAVPGRPAPNLQAGPGGAPVYGSGIIAQRDSRGKLIISNLAPEIKRGPGTATKEAMAQLEPIIREAAAAYNLPPALIRAVIRVESNFVPWAVSPKGAMGLMQLMPGTAADLGVREPFNPRENVLGGCRYLRGLINSFSGSLPLALAAYNAGYQRVVNCGYQVPNIRETQDFLTQVIGWYLSEEKKAPRPWT